MTFLLIILSLILLIYAGLILFVRSGIQSETFEHVSNQSISIVIPCRNEEKNIAECLKAIRLQDYPKHLFEVILVNDQSEDQTMSVAETFLSQLPLRLLNAEGQGKKHALYTGVLASKYQLIITLDADCVMGSSWLSSMVNTFLNQELNMLCGPVSLISQGTQFQTLQQAESAAVVGISTVMLNAGKPATCNGANLLFDKSVFMALGAYAPEQDIASGDDDLLMHRFFELNPSLSKYSLNKDAIVFTMPATTITDFLQQRLRWISKRKAYRYPYNSMIQTLVLFHLLAWYSCLCLAIFSPSFWALSLMGLKLAVDLFYAVKIKSILPLKISSVLWMPFYQLYILPLLFLSWFKKARWKGRTV